MQDAEIVLNLWYVADETGAVYSLRARAYIGVGSDEEKLMLLRRFAAIDYLIAAPFPIPEQFHVHLDVAERRTESKRLPVAMLQALDVLGGPVVLFEDAMRAIESGLPSQTALSIGDEPLVCITPLFVDDEGNLRPVTDRQAWLTGRTGVRGDRA